MVKMMYHKNAKVVNRTFGTFGMISGPKHEFSIDAFPAAPVEMFFS